MKKCNNGADIEECLNCRFSDCIAKGPFNEKKIPEPAATKATIFKRYREKRKANGLCARCGKNPPEPGRISCKACLLEAKEYRRRRKEGIT